MEKTIKFLIPIKIVVYKGHVIVLRRKKDMLTIRFIHKGTTYHKYYLFSENRVKTRKDAYELGDEIILWGKKIISDGSDISVNKKLKNILFIYDK